MSHKPSYREDGAEALKVIRRILSVLPDVPHLCPVCDQGRQDAAAVALHNIVAAKRGCRVYPA